MKTLTRSELIEIQSTVVRIRHHSKVIVRVGIGGILSFAVMLVGAALLGRWTLAILQTPWILLQTHGIYRQLFVIRPQCDMWEEWLKQQLKSLSADPIPAHHSNGDA